MGVKKAPVFLLVAAMIAAFLLTGCGGPKKEPANTVPPKNEPVKSEIKVTDFRGKEVVLKEPARRIACLLDSGLTGLHMLGVRDEVVALDKWTYENDGLQYTSQIDPRIAAKELPAVTGNMEKLISLKPDIVIVWAQDQGIKQMEENGLKVYGVQINKFDDIYKEMEDLGRITGKEARARELIDYTKGELDKLSGQLAKVSQDRREKALFVWGPSKLDLAGKTSTGGDILVWAGAVNLAGQIDKEHFVAGMEQVINWNPQSIIMWNNKKIKPEDYYKDPQWLTVKAVKDKKVYMLPNFFFCDLWTLKFQYSIKSTAKWLYPEIFTGMDLEKEKRDMIVKLYGKEIK